MNPDIKGLIIGIIGSIIYDFLKKQFSEKHIDNQNGTSDLYNPSALRRQFYICLPSALILDIVTNYIQSDSFWYVSAKTVFVFCIVLSISAFVCAMEEIDYFHRKLPNNPPKDNPKKKP